MTIFCIAKLYSLVIVKFYDGTIRRYFLYTYENIVSGSYIPQNSSVNILKGKKEY